MQQWDYVAQVIPITVPAVRRKFKDATLTPQERTQYLSLTQPLSWPARATMKGLCYRVSDIDRRRTRLLWQTSRRSMPTRRSHSRWPATVRVFGSEEARGTWVS